MRGDLGPAGTRTLFFSGFFNQLQVLFLFVSIASNLRHLSLRCINLVPQDPYSISTILLTVKQILVIKNPFMK